MSSSLHLRKKIWAHTLDIFKGLIHGLRYTNKAYELLRIFVFQINNMITYYGCSFPDILKEMIYFVNILRNGYGCLIDMAQKLF